VLTSMSAILEGLGSYEVKAISGLVTQRALRNALHDFFETDGELLLFYYGHGVLRPPGVGVLATSDYEPGNEGLPMSEVTLWAHTTRAREAIVILDCCHAGAVAGDVAPVPPQIVRSEAAGFAPQPGRPQGRAILAGCASHQQGWEAPDKDSRLIGVFSSTVMKGLKGEACLTGRQHVRASSLGNYITEAFASWNQSPVAVISESGERHCVITRKLDVEEKVSKNTVHHTILGAPFKPSQHFV